jgi:hypothetical protein
MQGFLMRANQPYRRFAAWVAVLLVHVPLVLLFLGADRSAKGDHPQQDVRADILYLLRLPQHVSEARGPTQETVRQLPKPSLSQIGSGTLTITMPEAPNVSVPYRPKPDWYRTAEEVAHSLTSASKTNVHLATGEYPHSPYRNCKHQPQFAWHSQPTMVGLDHHLVPYLRLGKYCVIALGSFGCAFGDLPPPNDHLFDHILERNAVQPPVSSLTYPLHAEPRGLCR